MVLSRFAPPPFAAAAAVINYRRKVLLPLLCTGALLRFVSFCLSENAGGDALARVALVAQWLRNPTTNLHFDVWLPMHFWLIAAISSFTGDVEFAGRLLSLVLGVASLYPFWKLTEQLDGAESAAYSTIIFIFYSLHIAYSATSSSETPYLFFLLSGLAFFFQWRNQSKLPFLFFAGFLLTISSGMRYEAWIVIFALDLILIYRREWKAFWLFVLTSGSWPVFWMSYEWITRGSPLYAPVTNHAWVAQDLAFAGTSLVYRLLLPPGVILITLTPLILIGLPFSIRYIVIKKGVLREFAFVVAIFAVLQVFQIVSGGVMSFARYTLTLGTMTAILTGIGLRQIRLYKKMLVGVLVSNLAALVLLSFVQNPLASKIRSVSPVLRFVPYLHDTGEYLKRHLGPEDAVVFDNYNHEANQLMALSGMSLLAGKRAFRVPDHSDPQEQATKLAQLSSYIHDQHPKYLVYSDRGEMREYFSLPIGCSDTQVGQLSFQCVFHNAYYRIYQLGYGTNVSDSTL